MTTNPWGSGIGTWAADAEQAEAEEKEAEAAAAAAALAKATATATIAESSSQSYPSLREAVTTKPKKKKMTLSEFSHYTAGPTGSRGGGGGGGGGAGEYSRLTHEEMLRLPTGPKERSAEEMQYGHGRLGGGFRDYGTRSVSGRGRDRDEDGSWGGGGGGGGNRRQYGGFDEERRGPPSRVSDFDQPSRADEVDNWASTKKPLPSVDSGRQNRYGSLGGGSRADEVDNWAVTKKPLAVAPPSAASASRSSFGSGFRDSGPEPDRWARGAGFPDREQRERPRLVLDPPKGDSGSLDGASPVKSNKPSPFGLARPREEVLAEKGLDWKKMENEIEAKKGSTPTSAHSSRPSSAQSNRSEGQGLQAFENVVKPRPKVNPFGDAKPREVLLEERGKDWRKIEFELEHRSVDRPETEEEKILKEEIDRLKKELGTESTTKENRESIQESGGDQSSLHDIISLKERELETLTRDLDDKTRFGQKAVERPGSGAGRPGSGAGRVAGFAERPPSQSGSFEEMRSTSFMDRPRSRGAVDMWSRPADERRSFGGGRDRGFLGSRDFGR
nr:eukaryotic translation initiation factor 4B1-like isoform X2 [Quercus suber]